MDMRLCGRADQPKFGGSLQSVLHTHAHTYVHIPSQGTPALFTLASTKLAKIK